MSIKRWFTPRLNCPEPPWRWLDPGIRGAVQLFVELGYTPCDSGDGVSKAAAGRDLDFPHVILLAEPHALSATCLAVVQDLEIHGIDMRLIDVQGILPVTAEPGRAFVCVGGESLRGITA